MGEEKGQAESYNRGTQVKQEKESDDDTTKQNQSSRKKGHRDGEQERQPRKSLPHRHESSEDNRESDEGDRSSSRRKGDAGSKHSRRNYRRHNPSEETTSTSKLDEYKNAKSSSEEHLEHDTKQDNGSNSDEEQARENRFDKNENYGDTGGEKLNDKAEKKEIAKEKVNPYGKRTTSELANDARARYLARKCARGTAAVQIKD